MSLKDDNSQNKKYGQGLVIIASACVPFWTAAGYGAMQVPAVQTAAENTIEAILKLDRNDRSCAPG